MNPRKVYPIKSLFFCNLNTVTRFKNVISDKLQVGKGKNLHVGSYNVRSYKLVPTGC